LARILLVHQPIDGGVARHVADLFTGLRTRGHHPVLCGPQVPVSLRGSVGPGEQEPLALQRAVAPGPDTRAILGLSRIVRRVRPDLIHAHSSKAGAVARLARLAHPGIPVLYTPHGYAMAGFFTREIERSAYREVERGLGLLTTRVLAVCEAEARLARTVTLPRRVTVVYNGVDIPPPGEPDPRVAALSARGPVVCAVAQLRPGKGVETLISAWPAIVDAHPGAQLVIAGDGVLRATLERQVRAQATTDSVHFLGEHPDPISVLRVSEAFVLASWAESFPYVILEAMALGLPIAASDVGGVGEAIADGVSGLLVPARRPEPLSSALTELIGNADLRARLGEAARQTVRRRFSIEAMVAGAIDVYDDTLDRR